MRQLTAVILCLGSLPLLAQTDGWTFRTRLEFRANFRDSKEAAFPLRFPFPSVQLPVGQTVGFEQTVDPGRHAELSVAQIRLDAIYGNVFAAHAQLHAQDKYRRNPTSEDRKMDADELWIRLGPKPEFLERPAATSVFLQMGKFPKMERQPIRLLESYGLAATAFNRFEDVGFMTGGSIGRNLYWRLQATSGNPLYFRDPNALAGDNKEETGGRIYTEWHGLTSTIQFTKQAFAGLHRQGEELEAGYQIPLGNRWVPTIQPAVRWSGLQNSFKGDPAFFPAPSIWWN